MEKMAHLLFGRSSKKARIVFSFLILLLASFLRLYRIGDYMTFLGDEGRDALVVYNILHGQLTLLGPTASVGGFFLGPLYYYFMAPFLWLFDYDPVGPAVMVALFGIATVYLVYKVGSEFFGKDAGFIAAFLYSISPIVIAYSRSSWNPNLMPFFSLLTLYVLYQAVTTQRALLYFASGILLGFTMQFHYLATFLAIIMAVYVFACQFHLITKNLGIFLLSICKQYMLLSIGFITGWSLFLAFEIRHGFPNVQSIIRFILHSGETGGGETFSLTIGNVFFRLFGRLVTTYPPPEQVNFHEHLEIAIWYYATFILGLGSIILVVFLFARAMRKKEQSFLALLLFVVWFFVGILLFGFYKKQIYDYYFGFLFPLPFLFVGAFFAKLFSYTGKLHWQVRTISMGFLVVVVAMNLQGISFRSVPNRQKEQVRTIAEFVLNQTGNKPFNFALLTLGNSDHGYRYFMKLEGKDPTVIQNPYLDPKRQTVTDQLFVICEDPSCKPLGNSLWEVAGFGRAEIEQEWNVSVVKVYKLIHYTGSLVPS